MVGFFWVLTLSEDLARINFERIISFFWHFQIENKNLVVKNRHEGHGNTLLGVASANCSPFWKLSRF